MIVDMTGSPLAGVLAAARAAGLARVVTVGTTLESSRWSARCAEEHDDVYAAVAIHPNEVFARGDEPESPPEPPASRGTHPPRPPLR